MRVLGGAPSWGPRAFSALSQRLRRAEHLTPWLAVGDAALAVDPISGSGVIRALRSARVGAETALILLDGGTSHIIVAYEQDRDVECTTYLNERALYYGIERRWQRSPFWQRRAHG
jgi:flavin-dependent dehydrogenase